MDIRRLIIGEVAQFEPPTIFSVAFSDQSAFSFNFVTKVLLENDGAIVLEFEDGTFAHISSGYQLYKVGSEIE